MGGNTGVLETLSEVFSFKFDKYSNIVMRNFNTENPDVPRAFYHVIV